MRKEGVILLIAVLSIILLILPAFSLNDTTTTTAGNASSGIDQTSTINNAYNCLKTKVATADNCASLSSEEQALSLLALAYDTDSQNNCQAALAASSSNDLCWPSNGCKIRDTALAILAKKYIGQSTTDSENWLLSKNITPSDLVWYLQIDTPQASTCKVNIDDGQEKDFSIGDDKKISGDSGGCLTLAQNDYWLKISSSCYDKKFTISCDQTFVTNLLYQKEGSQTIFVSSKTSPASANGQTEESVNVKCFGQGSSCDYEGSLWATLALSTTNHDVSAFLPYLSAAAADNEKYNPYTFLYHLTADDVYLSNALGARLPAGYWQSISTPYDKYYDSALAIMFLSSSSAQEVEETKTYFLSIKSSDGCWPSIRDSAILLYAGWPRAAANVNYAANACEPTYYCISRGDCTAAYGENPSGYSCPSVLDVCCSKPAILKSCVEKSGTICPAGEGCAGGSFVVSTDSTDNKCCVGGTCAVIQQDNCAGTCKSSCASSESLVSGGTCSDTTNFCCGAAKSSLWWLWLLIILIILAILAYFFRDRLKVFWAEISSKFHKSPPPVPQGMRGYPPRYLQMPPNQFQRQGVPPRGFPSQGARSSDFDSTLKKLKEMSQ